jgi:hypothetical protein
VVDGRTLTFRLAGINNQNFLMRDEETGSYWQQISGLAVSGPMRGRQLPFVHSDELSFGLWRGEHPGGTVLAPVATFVSQYESKDWDERMKRVRTVVDTRGTGVEPRELMLGVEQGGAARAYVLSRVLKAGLVQDFVGGVPVLVVVGPDGKSVRVFEAATDFYREADGRLMDSVTGSRWSFQGCAVEGPARGQCLRSVPAIRDYWFDWRQYHPSTTVFGLQ